MASPIYHTGNLHTHVPQLQVCLFMAKEERGGGTENKGRDVITKIMQSLMDDKFGVAYTEETHNAGCEQCWIGKG